MINRSLLVGRMTRDPELRRTANGTAVASFTLALNRNFTNQSGERQVDFIPCIVWNKAAENVCKYCSKGSLVAVDGRLQSRQYETEDRRRVTVIEVVCEKVQYLETKAQSANRQRTAASQEYKEELESIMKANQSQQEFNMTAEDFNITDDDIQF